MPKITRIALFFLLANVSVTKSHAQSEPVVDAYEDYTEAPREIAYVHLNKSTYIKGEMMGFTAYLLDKATKSLS
ncbi:hypothetical protein, partial [Winogradskyella sp.]|uniref:hypothetical protein n=1 Tax=Winogradskyella sp. TaxID=1883156 RepID=UPI002637DB0B